jgi:DNA invertase Pin-like site-specific DNA recombinase
MRLIGYVRRSCKYQQGDNYSQAEQRRKLEGYCRLYGHELVDIVQEDVSGASVAGRRELKSVLRRILHDSRGESLDGLLVVKLDRFSRCEADAHLIKSAFDKRGKGIICVDEPIDTTSEYGDVIFGLLVSLAAAEYKTIVRRMRGGRDAARAAGRDLTAVPKFGMQRKGKGKDSKVVVNQSEQTTLDKMWELFSDGWNNQQVTEWLNSQTKLNEKGKTVLRYPPKRAEKWYRITVDRLRKDWEAKGSPWQPVQREVWQ